MRRLTEHRLAVLCGLTFVLRAPSFVRPFMDIDEGSYAAIACRMLQGGLPYRDGVENKFPGIFYVYKAIFALFGRYDMVAVHVVTALVALLTALVCGAIAKKLSGSERSAWVASLGYVVFSTVYYPKMLAGNTEMFVVLPSALAIWCYLDGRPLFMFLAGALAGVTTLLKQVAGAVLCAMGADRVVRGWRERGLPRALLDLLIGTVGFALVMAGAVAGLSRLGVLKDAEFWTWTYVFQHYLPSGNADHGFVFNLLTNLVPFTLTVSPLVFLATRARKISVVWWWLFGMLCAALIGGRMYGHYFLMMLPPLSVAAGVGAADPSVDRFKKPLVAVSAFLAFGFLVYACLFRAETESFWSPRPDYRKVGAWVQAHTKPDERVFVWGWFPPLYQAADRCPSTRFVYTHVLAGSAKHGGEARAHNVPEGWDMLMHDLEAEPPPYILDTSHGDYSFQYAPIEHYERLWSFMQPRYTLETEIEGVRLYRRK